MIYEYRCEECRKVTEQFTNNMNLIEIKCPRCGGRATKILSTFTFNFYDLKKRREQAKEPDFYYTT